MDDEEEMLTLSAACVAAARAAGGPLPVSRQTILNWCTTGLVPGAVQTPKGKWLVPASTIGAWPKLFAVRRTAYATGRVMPEQVAA